MLNVEKVMKKISVQIIAIFLNDFSFFGDISRNSALRNINDPNAKINITVDGICIN